MSLIFSYSAQKCFIFLADYLPKKSYILLEILPREYLSKLNMWTGKFNIEYMIVQIPVDVEIFESTKKNLRIQKHLDMCKRGLKMRAAFQFYFITFATIQSQDWEMLLSWNWKMLFSRELLLPILETTSFGCQFSPIKTFWTSWDNFSDVTMTKLIHHAIPMGATDEKKLPPTPLWCEEENSVTQRKLRAISWLW